MTNKISINKLKQIIKKEIKNNLFERLVSSEERIQIQGGRKVFYKDYNEFIARNEKNLLIPPRRFDTENILEFFKVPGNLHKIYDASKTKEKNSLEIQNIIIDGIIPEVRTGKKINISLIEQFSSQYKLNFYLLFYEILDYFDYHNKILDVAEQAYEYFDENGNLPESENLDNYEYNISTEEKFKSGFETLSNKVKKSFFDIDVPLGDFALNINRVNVWGEENIVLIGINPSLAIKYIYNLFYNLINNSPNKNKFSHVIKLEKSDAEINMFTGYISLKKLKSPYCYGSYAVYLGSAKEGYGPKMYSIAASWVKRNGGQYKKITSHRSSVKPAARKVWRKTFEDRVNDFDAYEFDDFNLPHEERRTPDFGWDDCDLHASGDLTDFYLNHAYEIKNPLNYSIFENKFEVFLRVTSRIIKSSFYKEDKNMNIEDIKENIKKFILLNGEVFFSREYTR